MENQEQDTKIRTIVYVCPVDHNGTSLFIKGWISPKNRNQTTPVILVHDLDESTDDYVEFAEKLADAGFNVYCFEMRIQSKLMKASAILNFDILSSDLLQVVAWIKHKELGKKPIIVGQGLGSLVCLYFTQNFSKFCAGVVFASPLFSLHEVVKPLKRFSIRTLAQVAPLLSTPHWLSFNFSDPLKKDTKKRKGRLPLYFTQELLIAISRSHKLFSRVSIPTLLLCPDIDAVCRYDFLKRLISKHKDEDKISMVMFDSEGHQILNRGEEFLPSVLRILIPWLQTHGNQY